MRRGILTGCMLALAAGAALASTVIGLSVEDQARLSTMVVVGEVLHQRGIDHPQHGIETAVTLKVTEVLKGDVRTKQAITFHTRGGEVDGTISEAMGEATFKPGEKVLVFIESVDGRLYNLGLSMGVWRQHENALGDVTFVRDLQDGLSIIGEAAVDHGPLGYADMVARIRYAVRNPRVDNDMVRGRLAEGR